MIKLKQLITEVKYDYGCVMAYLAPEIAARIVEFGNHIITDDMLYLDPAEPDDYGREKEPHTTIKFGLTESYPKEKIGELLRGTKKFPIRVTGMSIFQNPKYDVVKLNIEGEELRRLRQIFDQVPNVDEYKIYHPHLTLAYLLPGLGKQFIRKTTAWAKIPISTIVYSDKGKKTRYNLK